MSREILQEIINDFSPDKFIRFFREESNKFAPKEEIIAQYNDENFKDSKKLGEIKFVGAEQLAVFAFRASQPLSERSGKKAQYEKGKKILKDRQYDAGIFIYYNQAGSFRFSLIYANYLGRKRDWSAFRRFTYFVGKDLTNKTFKQRVGDGDFSSLEKIKDAFSVEKVTKEFYLEYRKLFDILLSELSKNHTFKNEASRNGLNAENFAKKLLGQIVFLYFVQKKGWLGVSSSGKWGEGNKNFMGDLFREAIKRKANFFNDYLEKLFYNALNNPRRNSVDPSFSKDFNCRIPFLNGGLFEAEYDWENSLMCLDNNIFKAIFDVFERYNFTIEEESPDDKEIAVDPEMLGQVFENLLPENLRKGKGTYYTPREIVYYMCRESLVNYLVSNHPNITEENVRNYIFYSESFENFRRQKGESFTPGQWKELDDLLKKIKVCDPACGSGAFLVGMLNLIVKLRIYLQTTPDSNSIPQKTEYELKKEAIQDCIYGVDIDPGAIEIAKLRLWLSLVVDYRVEDIEPLPNLDYRLMCGNSLLEEYEGVKFYNGDGNEQQATLLVDIGKQEKITELKKKVKEYFDIHDDKEKQTKRKEINDVKDWLVRSALEKRKQDLVAQRKNEEAKADMLDKKSREKYLASWGDKFLAEAKIKEVLDNLHNPKAAKPFFIWKLEFIDVFEDKKGFDIVIANPPYVDSETMTKNNDGFRDIYSKIYTSAKGNWDLFIVFIERGLGLLKENAVITYIVPNKLLAARYSFELRNILLTKNIKEIRDYSEVDVFKEVDVYPVVFVIQNSREKEPVLMTRMKSETEIELKNSIPPQIFYGDLYWGRYFFSQKILETTLKISNFPNLSSICKKVSDAATVSEAYELKNYINEENSKQRKNYKKLVNTGTIDRYTPLWGKTKTQYIKNGYLKPVISDEDLKSVSLNRYKQACSEKIIIAGMSKELECIYDAGEYLAGKSTTIILKENIDKSIDLKFLLSILNSKVVSFWYKVFFGSLALAGGYLQINNKELERIPVPKSTILKQKSLIRIVDKILTITKSGDYLENNIKQTKVKEYEKQIDQLVYKLYGLTPEEIKIVENSSKK